MFVALILLVCLKHLGLYATSSLDNMKSVDAKTFQQNCLQVTYDQQGPYLPRMQWVGKIEEFDDSGLRVKTISFQESLFGAPNRSVTSAL